MNDDLGMRLREQAREISAAGISGWGNASELAADEIERLTAERDALKQDAERYQFIRTHYDVSAMRRGFADLLALRPSDVKLPSTGPTMDLFIDGRRKGEQP